jgi:hypothetical protein
MEYNHGIFVTEVFYLRPKKKSYKNTRAATTSNKCINPPASLKNRPNSQKNTTIPPNQRKKPILVPHFHMYI